MTYFQTATFKKLKALLQDNSPRYIVVHHTGGDNGIDTSNQTAKIVEDYHLSLGWEGIGYHFFIAKNGEVWQGRPEHYHGAHVKENGMNYKSIGICLAGNFDVTLPTQPQIDSLKQIMKDMMAKYKIPASSIFPHRHYALNASGAPYKSCYGTKLTDTWAVDLLKETPPVTPPIATAPIPAPSVDCKAEVDNAKKGLLAKIISFLQTL